MNVDNLIAISSISQNITFRGESLIQNTKNNDQIVSTILLYLGKWPTKYPYSLISSIPGPSEISITTIPSLYISNKPIEPSINKKEDQTNEENSKSSSFQMKLSTSTNNKSTKPKYLPNQTSTIHIYIVSGLSEGSTLIYSTPVAPLNPNSLS